MNKLRNEKMIKYVQHKKLIYQIIDSLERHKSKKLNNKCSFKVNFINKLKAN